MSDSPVDAPPTLVLTPNAKYRLRFVKAGDMRLVSHHDLMHTFERMLRRADLPMAMSQGFHPMPRMVFAQALALGTSGLREVIELELTQALSADDVHTRLGRQCPAGLSILSVSCMDLKSKARPTRAHYRMKLPAAEATPSWLERGRQLLDQSHCLVERSRPKPRSVDVRPFIEDITVDGNELQMILSVSTEGAARPEEVARLLGLGEWLDAGAYFERTDLELADETSGKRRLAAGPHIDPAAACDNATAAALELP